MNNGVAEQPGWSATAWRTSARVRPGSAASGDRGGRAPERAGPGRPEGTGGADGVDGDGPPAAVAGTPMR
ncbi:hypothetical protein GCM10009802_31950 [Streptomyces synnematoformans]|uniref:Uncharacterized protein n=1 Tax=Streptomyces synnematoformans TaxID=415721 RepID=A0ABN2YG72_9ACTN